jgi:hypothetical protein
MTSMTDPGTSNFLICWPVYRAGEDMYLQNALIFSASPGQPSIRRPRGTSWSPGGQQTKTEQNLRVGHVHGLAQEILPVRPPATGASTASRSALPRLILQAARALWPVGTAGLVM